MKKKGASPEGAQYSVEGITALLEGALQATTHDTSRPVEQQITASHRKAVIRLNAELSAREGYQPITTQDMELMVRATVTAQTLQHAIQYMVAFAQAVFPRIGTLVLEREGDIAILQLDTRRRRPSAGSCLLDTIGLLQYSQLLQWLLGERLPLIFISLGYTDFSLAQPILPLFGCPRVNVATRYALAFKASTLARPVIRGANDVDSYTRTLPVQLVGHSQSAPLLRHQVTTCLESSFDRGMPVPRPPELAAMLAMSESTLRRRLHREGETYSTLLEDVRRSHAQRYLDRTELPVETIAWRLGFSDASALRRAFRRWTGLPLSSVRKGDTLPSS
ncbi:MAG: helix-turn-helix domain-containing protein [Proteobacteria bacterium]|nr:helix-turn-helix domain-containing protein [Pseudomonadota bacterium]HQR04098.1 helix-turn-helix domain-containing protein [Rhodocyclaceae bacterium]